MSVAYRTVQWNAHKRVYDLVIIAGIGLYLALFMVVGSLVWRGDHAISLMILLIRAFGTCSVVMLHLVLCIGPLARLEPRMAPLLYNRRHFGVATFLVGLGHASLVLLWYHGFGVISPPVSLLASNVQYRSISAFPFEMLGAIALLILFLMAATSHDFWLANLSPRVWKRLHRCVYLAYALLVAHVALGALQSERALIYPTILGAGVVLVSGLHLAAGLRENRRNRQRRVEAVSERWINACNATDIEDGAAVTVTLPTGERVAVYRNGTNLSAISDRCAHQGGPLGEGRIVGGCVTCPWHGYQYRPEDGQSPPPYTEKLPTYRATVNAGRVMIDPLALPPGTRVEPARIDEVNDE